MLRFQNLENRSFLPDTIHGHRIHLVETFVERERFPGTCYRAAGWIPLGRTTGPDRNSPGAEPQGPRKEVLLQPLSWDFRRQLGA